MYWWNPGSSNLLITKTCFPFPEVTVIFKFPLGLSQQENGKKAQIPKRKTKLSISLILSTPNFLKSSFSQEVQKLIVPLCYLM